MAEAVSHSFAGEEQPGCPWVGRSIPRVEDAALLFGQSRGNLQLYRHVQIPAAVAIDYRNPFAAQTKYRIGLRAFRDMQLLFAFQRRHLDIVA